MKAINVTNYDEMLAEAVKLCPGNKWEENFVQDTSDKYDKYGKDMFVSDKQVAALARISGIDPVIDMDAKPPKPAARPARPHPADDEILF